MERYCYGQMMYKIRSNDEYGLETPCIISILNHKLLKLRELKSPKFLGCPRNLRTLDEFK